MVKQVYICGLPSDIGGANTELWHTVKLWRRYRLAITLIPTWQADPTWRTRLEAIGCRVVETSPERLADVDGLAGSVVVSMCNTKFLAAAGRFRELRCRIVWVGCMNWLFPREVAHYRQFGPFDRYVFQSRYQRDQLCPQLRRFGFDDEQGHLIRGAFDPEPFPFRPLPHTPGKVFTIGRISRAAIEKFSPRTWEIYARVPHPIRARVLGWSDAVGTRLGPPPPWATCLDEGRQASHEFLAGLHAMVHASGRAVENWPRVGLEAMAAGVPVVADDRGGWREMIRHGETGFLCNGDDEFAYHTARLAYDEPLRQRIIRRARTDLVQRLADPATIWRRWQRLFESISTREGAA